MILAAGEATRMGVAKPALPFGRSTMVGTVVGIARTAELDPVVVVTGFHAEEVEAVIPDGVTVVRNPDPGRGNMSSLLVGIHGAGDVDAVVVLLSDMPGVEPRSIEAVCAALASSRTDFAWTQYIDGRGHPIGISSRGAVAIEGLSGTKALWPLLDSLDEPTAVGVAAHVERPADVNTPDDYDQVAGRSDGGDILAP